MRNILALVLSFAVFTSPVAVADPSLNPNVSNSFYRLTRNTDSPRSAGGVFLSFLLPAWSQWREDQHPWAEIYSGAAVAGLAYAGINLTKTDGAQFRGGDRNVALGLQLYQEA